MMMMINFKIKYLLVLNEHLKIFNFKQKLNLELEIYDIKI